MAVPPGVRRSWDARGEWGASTLGAPGESWAAIIAALHAVGATWLEVRAAPDALVHTGLTAAERSAVRARLAASGITTLAIASGVRLGAPVPTDVVVADLSAHLHLAVDLGAPFVRVFPGAATQPGPTDHVPDLVRDRAGVNAEMGERLGMASQLAADLGVGILVETHDSHLRGSDIVRLLDAIPGGVPASVGVIWDLLHPWRVGESPADTWRMLGPWLREGRGYVQIKDVAHPRDLTPVLPGTGQVPLREALRILRRGGYSGPVSLEWERTWYPDVPTLGEAMRAVAEADLLNELLDPDAPR